MELIALGEGEVARLRKGLLDERLSVKPGDLPGAEPMRGKDHQSVQAGRVRKQVVNGPVHADDDVGEGNLKQHPFNM